MGNLVGKVVEMQYDGSSKTIKIRCDGIVYTHQGNNEWHDVKFVFALKSCGASVQLL